MSTLQDQMSEALKENNLWVEPPRQFRGEKKYLWLLASCRTFNQFAMDAKRRNLLEVFDEVQEETKARKKKEAIAQHKHHLIARRIREDPRYSAPHFRELVSRRNRSSVSRLELISHYNGDGFLDLVLRKMDANKFHFLKNSNVLCVQDFVYKID